MSSLFPARACRRAFAVALASLFAFAPARGQQPQHAGHDTTTAKMPAKMKMGTPTRKKQKSVPPKPTASAAKKQAGAKSGTRPRSRVRKSPRVAPTESAPTQKPPAMPGMKMDAHAPASRGDTAHAKMDTTEMEHMPVAARDTTGMRMHGHTAEDMMIGPAGVSMERMGSGTTWIPDAVTLPNRRRMLGDWMIMAHGFAFLEYDKQSGERGDDQLGSLNWLMLMATHDARGGRFQARTMLSLDPLTVTNRGYPLLLQSGESFNAEPLHDRQHPHDFWMELGALYQRSISKSLAWSLYAAPSGEPALGPVAFMHRPSAMDNPAAPISHHWQDATHVSFGVVTAGIFGHSWQVEASVFNGREPDQHRWNFDPIRLNSYSGRLTLNPNTHWSFEAGYGYLKSPEALNPSESMHRITTSVQQGARRGSDGQVATTFIWAANKTSTIPGLSNSFLLESEAILDKRNTIFGRTELVNKSAEDLAVVDPITTSKGIRLPGLPADEHFNVATVQLGYIRELARTRWATIGLGAAGTVNFVPNALEPYYGSTTPVGTFIFLRLRPFHSSRKPMTNMGGMTMGLGNE